MLSLLCSFQSFSRSHFLERPDLVFNHNSWSVLGVFYFSELRTQEKNSLFFEPHIISCFCFGSFVFSGTLRFVRISLWIFLVWSVCFPGKRFKMFFGTLFFELKFIEASFFLFHLLGKFDLLEIIKFLVEPPQRMCWVPSHTKGSFFLGVLFRPRWMQWKLASGICGHFKKWCVDDVWDSSSSVPGLDDLCCFASTFL